MKNIPLRLRGLAYALRGGFLIRPLLIALILGAIGGLAAATEATSPPLWVWTAGQFSPSPHDPAAAQAILSLIAQATMTVVSIVFAILLMTLTLASMQFSPRILISFVRDRGTQWTLGIFLGTFCYCMAALPAARNVPHPFAPVLTVDGAMVLALLCVGWLLFFIHHISQAISVNHIVDRIAFETETVIADLMPQRRGDASHPSPPPPPDPAGRDYAIINTRSGYIKVVDSALLLQKASEYHVRARVMRKVGDFVPAGVPLIMLSKRLPEPRQVQDLLDAFDIGPMRSLQQDVEFGVIQIVDIGLRAISPAVNDPSTAISCIDQLTRILVAWLARVPPKTVLYAPPHVARVMIPWIDFEGLLDTAFEQLRVYAVRDAAVSLRLLRMLQDVAITIDHDLPRQSLLARGRLVVEACRDHLPPGDIARLERRTAKLAELCQPVASM